MGPIGPIGLIRPITGLRSVLILLALGPCLTASARDPFRTSVNEQIHLGQQVAAQIRRQFHALPATDQRVQVLRRIGRRILSTFPDSETWQYSFDVIEDKQVNAFALPGGPTFFYTGLIDRLKTEDELAGVMGHELTHVRKQHWAHNYEASQNRGLLLNLGLILLHANNEAASLAGIG